MISICNSKHGQRREIAGLEFCLFFVYKLCPAGWGNNIMHREVRGKEGLCRKCEATEAFHSYGQAAHRPFQIMLKCAENKTTENVDQTTGFASEAKAGALKLPNSSRRSQVMRILECFLVFVQC